MFFSQQAGFSGHGHYGTTGHQVAELIRRDVDHLAFLHSRVMVPPAIAWSSSASACAAAVAVARKSSAPTVQAEARTPLAQHPLTDTIQWAQAGPAARRLRRSDNDHVAGDSGAVRAADHGPKALTRSHLERGSSLDRVGYVG